MKKRVYIQDWLNLKPYDNHAVTDSYYLNICNDVKKVITSNQHSIKLENHLEESYINLFSCFLTSYFEDLISETNIWNSFVKIHHRLYKKQLPFFSLDEYYESEVNQQDLCVLIWYFLNTIQKENFISPFNEYIIELAEKIIEVFDKEWEYAPENEYLKSFYQIDENEDDYYIVRNLIDTILFKTYLFYLDTSVILLEKEVEIIDEHIDSEETTLMMLNETRDVILHNSYTRLHCLKGKEWASEILGCKHRLHKEILNISQRIVGLFLYKGQDDENVFIEHISSSKKFNLSKKSFDLLDSFTEIDTILYLGIVRWKNEWWFSGVFFKQPFSADVILDEKNSIERRGVVNFLDHNEYQKEETERLLELQYNTFKKLNNGSDIMFLPSDKIQESVQKYFEYYNESLGLSPKEHEEAIQRVRNDGFFGGIIIDKDFSDVSDSGLVFFNPKCGIEIAMNVNSAFPLSNNPFYKVENAEEDVIFLLMSEEFSKELTMYCIELCKNELPFFTEDIGKKYLEDIDFLLRFWKNENYFAKPLITFTGHDVE